MRVTVDDHQFSAMDARRALAHATEFLDDFPDEAHAHQTARRERITAALVGLDPMQADEDDLQGPINIVWRELLDARDDVVAADALPDTATGRVVRLSVSDGGVPKTSVEQVEVGFGGVIGDRQNSRRHHGSPFQALCLWNVESIDHLAAEGHPIGYGSAGENVTISGVDWPAVRPGVRLLIGTVLCEISSHAEPCSKNAQWFSDRDFSRIHDRNGPWSRMYATVLRPGTISTGDRAVVEPSRAHTEHLAGPVRDID